MDYQGLCMHGFDMQYEQQQISARHLFYGDQSDVDFVESNPMMKIICASARSTLKIDKQECQNVTINIGIDEILTRRIILACEQYICNKAYRCKTCLNISIPVYLCQSCFLNNTHIQQNHEYEQILIPQQINKKIKCKCGNVSQKFEAYKKYSTCKNHTIHLQKFDKLKQSQLHQKLKQHTVDCFKIYIASRQQSVRQGSKLAKLSQEYLCRLTQALIQLCKSDEQFLSFVMQCFETNIQMINKYSQEYKGPLALYFIRNQIYSQNINKLFTIFFQNHDDVFVDRVIRQLATSYVKNTQELIISKNKNQKINQYYQKMFTLLLKANRNCTEITKLAKNNIVPYSKDMCKLHSRTAVMKYYCMLSKIIKLNNISLQGWQDILKILFSNKLLYLQFIPDVYSQYFLQTLQVMADSPCIVSILDQLQTKIKDKDKAHQSRDTLICICQIIVNIIKRLNVSWNKYISVQKHKRIVDIIKDYDNNQTLFNKKLSAKSKNILKQLAYLMQNQKVIQQHHRKKQSKNHDVQQTIKLQYNSGQMQHYDFPMQQGQIFVQYQVQNKNKKQYKNNSEKIEQKSTKQKQKQDKNKQKLVKKQVQMKVKEKTAQQIAMQKKRQKLNQKFQKIQTKVLKKNELQHLKSKQQNCGICRQSNTKDSQLFVLGYISNQISMSLKTQKISKYSLFICNHAYHVSCLISTNSINKCPLCKQSYNIIFLADGLAYSGKSYAQFYQMIKYNKYFKDSQIWDILMALMQIKVSELMNQIISSDVQNQQQLGFLLSKRQNQRKVITFATNMIIQFYDCQVEEKKQKIRGKFKNLYSLSNGQQLKQQNLILLYKAAVIKSCNEIVKQLFTQNQIYQLLKSASTILQSNDYSKMLQLLSQHKINIQVNENTKQTNATFLQSIFQLSRYEAIFFNNFTPMCKKYIQHYPQYYRCLICNITACGFCDVKYQQHSRCKNTIKIYWKMSENQLIFRDKGIQTNYENLYRAKPKYLPQLDQKIVKQIFSKILYASKFRE